MARKINTFKIFRFVEEKRRKKIKSEIFRFSDFLTFFVVEIFQFS